MQGISPSLCGAEDGAGTIDLQLDGGRLTLEARGTNLSRILGEIGRVADFDVVLVGGFDDSGPIDLGFSDLAVEQALGRLLRGTNHILFRAPDGGAITQVWLLQRGSGIARASAGTAGDTLGEDSEAAAGERRDKAVLRLANRADGAAAEPGELERIQATLLRILAADPDPLVRTRAALALGKIADVHSVAALAAATRDAHATVRAQAIATLGEVDSRLAADALGQILLDPGRAARMRMLAANALWRHGDAAAREYLARGALDPEPQVRQASSQPPPALPDRPLPDRRGPAEAR